MPRKTSKIKLGLLLLCTSLLFACTSNSPYHSSNKLTDSSGDQIRPPAIQESAAYDLAFVEYTDRGNIFSREQLDNVLDHVDHYAETGATVITYVHGWKHNSSENDSNLKNFKALLQAVSDKKLTQGRKLIGVYIGWRGLSLKLAGLKNLTYWQRKRVAHDVGKGGITELLLRLEKSLYKKSYPSTKNILVNSGHSMGGAILLSALNDVLMARLLDTENINGCVKTKPFGHSVLLINPAVEANEIFQLEELVKQNKCYDKNQAKLLHIISSEADTANKFAFKTGQWFGVSLRRNEVPLKRKYRGKSITLHEQDLDTTTIANLREFHTGKSISRNSKNMSEEEKRLCALSADTKTEECYIPCREGAQNDCVDQKYKANHIPVVSDEPLSFVYTDKAFMSSHSDIFHPKIAGYLTTITEEAQYKRRREAGLSVQLDKAIASKACLKGDKFVFPSCFQFFKEVFESTKKPKLN